MLASATKAGTGAPAQTKNSQSTLTWQQIVEPAEPFLAAVSQRLRQQIREFDSDIEAYAEYALNGQGKQLRPLLVALSANASGKLDDSHVTVAVIIEMVHLATLVHDDVMDEADIRRGRRTLAANWGNEIAVLLGDCLFAHSLKLAASFPTPEICRAVSSATNTVCSGEILQTRARGDFNLALAKYFKMLEMKTGELFALSCDLGGYLCGVSAAQRGILREFGMALGTAYQLYDDCVDIFGSETVAGKSLGTDLVKGKLTLPVLLLRDKVSASEREQLEALVKDWQPANMPMLREMLARHGIAAETLLRINQFSNRARALGASLPNARMELVGLTDFLARQTEAVCA
jgi:octaprenyl-diphosphate synthase